jgi:hypothetical protein
MFGHANG